MFRVLIVDDKREVLGYLRTVIEQWDSRCNVIAVVNEQLAEVELNKLDRLDVAIVDLYLVSDPPGPGEGVLLLKKIRERFPDCRTVLLTGYFTPQELKRKLQGDLSSIDETLSLHYDNRDFRAQLEKVLGDVLAFAN